MLSRDQLQRAAAESGFQIESYEKVYVLVRLPHRRSMIGAVARPAHALSIGLVRFC
jgi:hypothetical protein